MPTVWLKSEKGKPVFGLILFPTVRRLGKEQDSIFCVPASLPDPAALTTEHGCPST